MASLLDKQGRRKYLIPAERERFLNAAQSCPCKRVRALCLTLLYTGCRVSEALNLKRIDVDAAEKTLVIRTLKQRAEEHRATTFRVIPIPETLVVQLLALNSEEQNLLWPIARSTAWRQIKSIMHKADVTGVHASPKGLRHGFAIAAVYKGVPVTLISRFMGHRNLHTTMIYLDFVGAQEREMVSLTWPKSKE